VLLSAGTCCTANAVGDRYLPLFTIVVNKKLGQKTGARFATRHAEWRVTLGAYESTDEKTEAGQRVARRKKPDIDL